MFHNVLMLFQHFTGRTAYIGLGFGDRSDSFDLNVALQDHFKWLRKEQEGEQAPQQNLDLGFKDGETIKINMKITVSEPTVIKLIFISFLLNDVFVYFIDLLYHVFNRP